MAGIGHTLSTHGLADIELPERWALARHIADGGMASVWCAQDSLLSRQVAIKVLAPRFRQDERAVRAFEREARAAARLSSHRNIVTIYDVGESWTVDVGGRPHQAEREPGPPFIVMEHLTGGSVADALRHRHVSPDEARRWIHEAAAALDYAHGHGVIHGDVKPGNLLLDGERVLHIADFGIARIAHEDTSSTTGSLFGTAAYISPEQALGKRATAASDRYALAIVAFELLTGERPFAAEGFAALARLHVKEPPPAATSRRPTLPPTLDPVLWRAMAKEGTQRWPTATALAGAIDAALFERRVMFSRSGAQLPGRAARIAGPIAPRPGPAAHTPPERRSHTTKAHVAHASPEPRRPGGQRRRARALRALGAVAALAAVIAVAIAAGQSSPHRHLLAATRSRPKPTRPALATVHATRQPATPKPTTSTSPAKPNQSASALEAEGHSLMLAGNYQQAVTVLQQALHAAAPGSLIYEWALYDLGHTYREMGNVQLAIPLLQQRLRYPDSRQVVAQELDTALSESHSPAARSHSPASTPHSSGGTAPSR